MRKRPAANALKFLLERIPGGDGIQQLHALIAAEGDEVRQAGCGIELV